MSEPNETTHRRVRIAVAVAVDGGWNSAGWSGTAGKQIEDGELASFAREPLEMGEQVSFIEAWVPRPRSSYETIEAEVRPQPIEGESENGRS